MPAELRAGDHVTWAFWKPLYLRKWLMEAAQITSYVLLEQDRKYIGRHYLR